MNRKYRKTVIAGNWKMNKTPSETKEFMTQLKAIMPKGRWCDVALCVPAVCIPAAVRAMRETRVGIGAESCRLCVEKIRPAGRLPSLPHGSRDERDQTAHLRPRLGGL